MLSAYMGDMKGDGNGFYFPYAASMTSNMVPQNFPTPYGMPLSSYEMPKDENYSTTLLAQQQQQQIQQPQITSTPSHQSQPKQVSLTPEDEESKKKLFDVFFSPLLRVAVDKWACERCDRKYRERRDKNNLAAKKSRSNRREREKLMQRKLEELEKENEALRAQLALYTQQLEYAKKEYERQMSVSYATQPQSMILRDTTNSIMANTQPPFFYSAQFTQQANIS
ncbi:unnamed protein product [Anisakis simplex]|uniref:BZIP domain-containing protein n=1 Tax=Anisakis simplex TaxID=6269 RepID=A0A0M3K240_ANISI|nr:unnamed protein product [Anisakis simplex]